MAAIVIPMFRLVEADPNPLDIPPIPLPRETPQVISIPVCRLPQAARHADQEAG